MKILSVSVSKSDGTSWATVDPNSLSDETKLAYDEYRELRQRARQAQEQFEALFRDEAGSDGIRFGYNFGKLTIAQGDAPRQKAAPKPTVSLEAFLGSQRANGRSL